MRSPCLLRDLEDRVHVAGEAADVHRHDRPRALRDPFLDPRGVDTEVVGLDVDRRRA